MLTLLLMVWPAFAATTPPSRLATCNAMFEVFARTPETPVLFGLRQALDLAGRRFAPPSPIRPELGAAYLDVYYDLAMMSPHSWVPEHHHRLIARLAQILEDVTSARAADFVIARELRGREIAPEFERFRESAESLQRRLETSPHPPATWAHVVTRFKRFSARSLTSTAGWAAHGKFLANDGLNPKVAFSMMSGSLLIERDVLRVMRRRRGGAPDERELAHFDRWFDEQTTLASPTGQTHERVFFDSVYFVDENDTPAWLLVLRTDPGSPGDWRRRAARFEWPALPALGVPGFAPALVPVRGRR